MIKELVTVFTRPIAVSVQRRKPGGLGGRSPKVQVLQSLPDHDAFPLFQENFQTLLKSFKILPFSEKFHDFHPPKFLMTFFVIDHKFRISLLFSLFQYISPLFSENYYSPYFSKIFPLF